MAGCTGTGTVDARGLAEAGVVHLASAAEALGTDEAALVAAVFAETTPHALDLTDDGWLLVLSPDTDASRAVSVLAGLYEDVPLGDLRLAVGKMLRTGCPVPPSTEAAARLARHLGAKVEAGVVDLSDVDWTPPTEEASRLHHAFLRQPGHRATPSTICKGLGYSGNRTFFHDHVLPAHPFLLRDGDRSEVRLVGAPVNWTRAPDTGRFHWLSRSADGLRRVVKLTLSQQMVESNSFNLPPDVRAAASGTYRHGPTGRVVVVGEVRKTKGLGPLIREAAPDYVDGQTALVLLDAAGGSVEVELVDALEAATEDAIVSAFLSPAMSLAA